MFHGLRILMLSREIIFLDLKILVSKRATNSVRIELRSHLFKKDGKIFTILHTLFFKLNFIAKYVTIRCSSTWTPTECCAPLYQD